MITFKQFLIEGGHATEKFSTQRAKPADVKAALEFVSKTIGIPYSTLKNDLLGSTELTLAGKKEDSGDIDIALELGKHDMEDINKKMLAVVNGEGVLNRGTKVGSYAVPVNGKKVQVDLMFVNSRDWAKFSYHSDQGRGSKYPGAVRNIIMMTALAHTQEPEKDFVMRDEEGNVVARASRSIKMDTGMERLFKAAKKNPKTGKYNKTLDKMSGEELEKLLSAAGVKAKFSKDPDVITDPKKVVEFIFGKGVKPEDVSSAEKVIARIKKLKNSAEILKAAKSELERLKMIVPEEL